MTIVNFIKSIAISLVYRTSPVDYPNFYHGEQAFQNIQADNDLFPVVYLDEPIRSRESAPTYVESEYSLSILFANKSELDWNTDKMQLIYEDMTTLARKFLLRLEKESDVKKVKNVSITQLPVGAFDTPVAGCILKFDIIMYNNLSNCLP